MPHCHEATTKAQFASDFFHKIVYMFDLRRVSHELKCFKKYKYTNLPKSEKMNPEDKVPGKAVIPQVVHTSEMDSALPPGADAEERFNNFWKENGTSIFVTLILAAIIVIGMQVWRYVEQRAEVRTQTSYSAADSSEELVTFALDHPKHPLAGTAYIKLANKEFADGQFMQAADHYRSAKDTLSGTPLFERATLGAAVSEYLGGNVEAGLTDLRAILDNPDFIEVTRAEAAFNLAMYYQQRQDYKALTEIVDIADTFGQKDVYAMMTRSFRTQIPEQK